MDRRRRLGLAPQFCALDRGLLIGWLSFLLTACMGVPPELKDLSTDHLAEALRVAQVAAQQCPDLVEQRGFRRFESPARNSSLAQANAVLQVTIACYHRDGSGADFPPLYPDRPPEENTVTGSPYMIQEDEKGQIFFRRGSLSAKEGVDLVIKQTTEIGWVEVVVVFQKP